MKKLLSVLLAVAMGITTASAEQVNPFLDVADDAWYYDEVTEAVSTGIISGKTETEFKPDDLLTYAEAIKLAACMNQVYTNGVVTLSTGDPWYQPFAEYCVENNIITKEYNYNDKVTRAGYMEIFANALPDEAFDDINNIPAGSILDVKDNAPYAIYVYKMYRAGIVTGVDELHNCNPEANIKRCEVATIISRMMDKGKRVEFDINEEDAEEEYIEKIYIKDDIIDDDDSLNETEEFIMYESDEDDTENEPSDETENKTTESEENDGSIVVLPNVEYSANTDQFVANAELQIYKQPEGYEAEEYGGEYKLEVQVFGGKAPYTYEWQYNGYRNQKTKIENGDYVSDAETAILILSIEEENVVLGTPISCKITDSEGKSVTTDTVKVYGPFSAKLEEVLEESGKYTLVGRVSDGILKKGEKVSVIRNGKVIAIGVAEDLQMFNKSLDKIVKGDNAGIVFNREDGVRPFDGDIVVKYQPLHQIDTSDIVN